MPVFRHALTCPRCTLALIEVTTPRITRHTCNGCGGVWIDDDDLRRLLDELALDPDAPLGPLELAAGTLRCPRCREAMAVERTLGAEPTALVDVCAAHGAWFDRDELSHALHQLQLARLEKERGPYHGVPDELKVFVWLYRLFCRDEPAPTRTRGRPD